ncbi:succinate dehydrogenase [Anaerosporomusa subterranea]|uniref:Succinate dehydrogenase n=1 Tax=Anaerosporomusa subterranea TaxID=1794912 RepID=A0A154BVX7_ANASB|nr:FAD-binding protein [Anaerosporomusa subterranea]KYZ78025.1 succinate dehydrogenase [Anaerosporomusa subterranea]
MKLTKTLKADVLVIGAGAAGLRAALAAAEAGSQVIVTNKGPVAKSGITLTAAGGMQAPFHPEDSSEQYFQDTVKCGYGLGDKALAKILADGACASVLDAERYGARFVRGADGNFSLGQFPGQSKPRNLFVKGGGIGLVAALAQACRKNENIIIVDDFFVTGLVKANSSGATRIAGAVGLNLKTGELTLIQATAVVMATGGCQWLWEVNDCPTDATGDGVVYAYRAGADLVDMEMVLFYPSVIVWPPSIKGAFVHYEFLAADVLDGNVYDKDGNAVLPKPLPVRDEAMRLMQQAISAGRGGPHGGLWWYVGDSPKGLAAVRTKLDIAQYNYIKSHGVDPSTAKIEVAPGAHYLMGGIHIAEQCQTTLQGLFATPECAGNFDGANRLAGSGITATQVFGARAGLYAHQWAAANQIADADTGSLEQETWRVARRIGKSQPAASNVRELRDRLRAAVQLYAGVNRDQAGLNRLAEIACEVQAAADSEQASEVTNYNLQLVDLLQLDVMCEVAQVVAGSALLRQESRGHHFRTDFPQQNDDNWLQHTLAIRTENGPRFSTKPVL